MQRNLNVLNRRTLSAAMFALAAVVATGCGPGIPQGTLAGTVSLDGKPYGDAAIMFMDPKTGQAAGTDINTDGTFAIEKPMAPGTYKAYLAPKSLPPEENGEPIAVSADTSVPTKYWNETTTDVEVTVNEGENNVQVALEK